MVGRGSGGGVGGGLRGRRRECEAPGERYWDG